MGSLFLLNTGKLLVGNSKVFAKLGNGSVRDLTLDTNTVYTHSSTKQCNYVYTHPTTKQCNAATVTADVIYNASNAISIPDRYNNTAYDKVILSYAPDASSISQYTLFRAEITYNVTMVGISNSDPGRYYEYLYLVFDGATANGRVQSGVTLASCHYSESITTSGTLTFTGVLEAANYTTKNRIRWFAVDASIEDSTSATQILTCGGGATYFSTCSGNVTLKVYGYKF